MKKDLKCYTKAKKGGAKYTTCTDNQKKKRKKPEGKHTHVMKDGTKHTGKKHTKDSKPVKKKPVKKKPVKTRSGRISKKPSRLGY